MSLGSSQDPSTCATCFASFLGVSFLLGGFALLLLSWINTREERIIMYDGAVHRWTNQARPSFATLQVTASAFSPSLGHASVRRLRMDKSEVLHWAVHDSEGGKGIEVFKPLKYVAQFSFPSYYGNATRPVPRDLLDSVPLQQDAPNATFTFNMVGAIANASSLNSISLPLVFTEIVHARGPAPSTRCSSIQHGVWKAGHCYLVRRLASLCYQVEADGHGGWRFRTSHTINARRLSQSGVGCDRGTNYDPAVYVVDQCWGVRRATPRCPAVVEPNFTVNMILRSSDDPYLLAKKLTKSRLDFGPSAKTQRVYGVVLLLVAAFISVFPCAQCHVKFCRGRVRQEQLSFTLPPVQMGKIILPARGQPSPTTCTAQCVRPSIMSHANSQDLQGP